MSTADLPPTPPAVGPVEAPIPSVSGGRGALDAVLADAQRIGLLGPGPVSEHIEHALAFGSVVSEPSRFADLGSGAGVPGLVLITLVWRSAHAVLVDSQQRRIQHLHRAVAALGVGDRVTVYGDRAEHAARSELRETFDLVVARAFGPPASVAECAAPLLRRDGVLVVSEPPATSPTRWPVEPLRELGFSPAEILAPRDGTARAPDEVGPVHVARLRRTGELSPRWPRSPSAMQKRPLWRA